MIYDLWLLMEISMLHTHDQPNINILRKSSKIICNINFNSFHFAKIVFYINNRIYKIIKAGEN